MHNSIKVYSGKGVEKRTLAALFEELSNYSPTLITSEQLIETDWEEGTSLLIMPGGRDVPYHEALSGRGNQKIRQYVEKGGAYLGICAGAYYACRHVDFDRGMTLEVIGERELAFFPGTGQGPAYGPGSFSYNSEKGARAALLSIGKEREVLRCYYNGGCFFPEADECPQVDVLARYEEIENHPAAIIQLSVGKGKVVLSGVHFEVGTTHPPSTLHPDMGALLIPHEEQRRRLFHSLIKDLAAIAAENTPSNLTISKNKNG